MRINPGNTVECRDGKVFDISHNVGAYLAAVSGQSADQRLFKPNGQYAGGDRSKNVAKVL